MLRFGIAKNKKIVALLTLGVLILFVGFLVYIPQAHAECGIGGKDKIVDCITMLPPMAVWMVLYVILTVLNAALAIVAYFLDQVFFYNIVLNPSNMPAVIKGWTIVRDIANGLFLLVVLWVALTIIFSIEQYGGRRLLVRIIIVALLINFSLVAVSVTFGFANALALPFRNAILADGDGNPTRDIGSVIMDKLAIQTLSNPPAVQQAAQVNTAAFDPNACGLNAITSAKVGCRSTQIVVGFANFLYEGASSNLTSTMTYVNQSISLALSIIVLVIVIISFLGAIGMLIGRIVAMTFLGILAPAAFLSRIMPIPGAQKIWDTWSKNLFCWAFFAPVFYFLLYLSILLLYTMIPEGIRFTGSIAGNLLALLPLVIFFVFLWITTTIGKRMSCMGADAFMNAAKVVGGLAVGTAAAVATGGATAALGAAGRGIAKTEGVQKTLEWAGEKPGLRAVAAPLARQRAQLMQKEQEDIDRRKTGLAKFAPRDVATIAKGSVSRRDQVAAMERLADTGDIDKLDIASQKRIFEQARRLGRDKNLERVLPDLAGDATAIDNAVKRIRTSDVGKISKTSFDDTNALNAFINNFRAEHYKQLARDNPEMLEKMFSHIGRNPTLTMPPGTLTYLQANAGRELGLMLPAAAVAATVGGGGGGGQQTPPQPPQPVQIAATALSGRANQPLSRQRIAVSGGQGPVTIINVQGLPPGVQFLPDGTLTGTPRTSGASTLTVTARDAAGTVVTQTVQLTIA